MTQLVPSGRRPLGSNPFEGQWAELHASTIEALLGEYASRGPQYEMLASIAAGLFVQTRRLEAQYAQLDDPTTADPNAMRVYTDAIEALRKVIDQAQRYTEARRQEFVRHETNAAVLEVLRIVETLVDTTTFLRVVSAVKAALER